MNKEQETLKEGEIEIAIPENKIMLQEGCILLPKVKLVITGNLTDNLLIQPTIGIGLPGEDLLYLDFTPIGPAAVHCKLDFVADVFKLFPKQERPSSNEVLPIALTTIALFRNLRLVMFDLKVTILRGKTNVCGMCRILLQKKVIAAQCDISNLHWENAIQLASYFEKIPTL